MRVYFYIPAQIATARGAKRVVIPPLYVCYREKSQNHTITQSQGVGGCDRCDKCDKEIKEVKEIKEFKEIEDYPF